MLKGKSIAVLVLMAIVVMATVPFSGFVYAQNQSQEEDKAERKAEKLVELADRAQERVDNLIRLIFANETANETITNAGLMDELLGNVTLFEQGVGNLTMAHDALDAGDYQGAFANATDALRIFCEVFKAIHYIMEQAGVAKGKLIDAQGLIQAMQRALERIERLREIIEAMPEDCEEALTLLDNAEQLLNITAARALLLEGKVSEVAHNLAEANGLIADAYQCLKEQAREMNTMRIRNYLRGVEQMRQRIMTKLESASRKGLNITAVLESLGYENETEFRQALQDLIEAAQKKMEELKKVLQDLRTIGDTIREIDRSLTIQIQHQHQSNNNGFGNNGNGHRNGNDRGNNGRP